VKYANAERNGNRNQAIIHFSGKLPSLQKTTIVLLEEANLFRKNAFLLSNDRSIIIPYMLNRLPKYCDCEAGP